MRIGPNSQGDIYPAMQHWFMGTAWRGRLMARYVIIDRAGKTTHSTEIHVEDMPLIQ